jgi:hypothetical protein
MESIRVSTTEYERAGHPPPEQVFLLGAPTHCTTFSVITAAVFLDDPDVGVEIIEGPADIVRAEAATKATQRILSKTNPETTVRYIGTRCDWCGEEVVKMSFRFMESVRREDKEGLWAPVEPDMCLECAIKACEFHGKWCIEDSGKEETHETPKECVWHEPVSKLFEGLQLRRGPRQVCCNLCEKTERRRWFLENAAGARLCFTCVWEVAVSRIWRGSVMDHRSDDERPHDISL